MNDFALIIAQKFLDHLKKLTTTTIKMFAPGHAAGGGLLRCMTSSRRFDYLDRLLFVTALPPLLACLLALCALVTPFLVALLACTSLGSRLDLGPPAFARAAASGWAWRQGCWACLALSWICLVEPSSMALHFFACIRLPVAPSGGDGSGGQEESLLLLRDLSVTCSSARYKAHQPIALAALAMYPVGGTIF